MQKQNDEFYKTVVEGRLPGAVVCSQSVFGWHCDAAYPRGTKVPVNQWGSDVAFNTIVSSPGRPLLAWLRPGVNEYQCTALVQQAGWGTAAEK